jgi:hypothetical protein
VPSNLGHALSSTPNLERPNIEQGWGGGKEGGGCTTVGKACCVDCGTNCTDGAYPYCGWAGKPGGGGIVAGWCKEVYGPPKVWIASEIEDGPSALGGSSLFSSSFDASDVNILTSCCCPYMVCCCPYCISYFTSR